MFCIIIIYIVQQKTTAEIAVLSAPSRSILNYFSSTSAVGRKRKRKGRLLQIYSGQCLSCFSLIRIYIIDGLLLVQRASASDIIASRSNDEKERPCEVDFFAKKNQEAANRQRDA